MTHPTRNQPLIKQTKTKLSRRDIELAAGLLNHLSEGKNDDFLPGGDTPLGYTQLRRMLNRIRKDIGFEETIVPRRFRTTVLTDICDITKDIPFMSNLIIYVHRYSLLVITALCRTLCMVLHWRR